MLRLMHYRLVIPFLRSTEPNHVLAMGCALGLFLGLTPTIGLQIPILIVLWGLLDRLLKVRFSLLVAVAFTWVSNPFTMVPLYYLYYMVGSALTLTSGVETTGYAEFSGMLSEILIEAKGMDVLKALESLGAITFYMFYGSVFIAGGGAVVGYFMGYKFATNRKTIRSWLLSRRRSDIQRTRLNGHLDK